MSKRSINPNQLKLFMTGTEWKNTVTHSTDGPIATVWQDKEGQSKAPTGHGGGVYASIAKKGYLHNASSPPTIIYEDAPNGKYVRTVQSEGHHRIAAAAAIEKQGGPTSYIPTNYVDNTRIKRSPS